MQTINDLRSKYPQYNDMSDAQFADAFHRKFYSDIPKDEFYSKIGMPSGGKGLINTVSDFVTDTAIPYAGTAAVKALAGVGSIPNMIGTLGQGITGGKNENSLIPSPFDVLAMSPSYSDIQSSLFEGTGTPEYKPDTALGKLGMEAASMAGSGALTPLGMGQKASALYGGLSGLGSEGLGQAFEGTALETPARMVGAFAAPIAGAPAMSKLQQIAQGATGNLSTSPEVSKILSRSLEAEGITPQSAISKISASDNKSLANFSDQLLSEASSAARLSPKATREARELSDAQINASREKIRGAVAKYISDSPHANLSEMTDAFVSTAKKEAEKFNPQVQKELAKGFTETAPRRAIGELYNKFPEVFDRVMKFATRTGAEFDPSSMKLRDLDTIKQGIDNVLYGSSDDLARRFQTNYGEVNKEGKSLLEIRSSLNDFLRKKSPALAERNDLFSGELQAKKAAEHGFSMLSDKPRRGIADFKDMSKTEKEAFLGGLGMYIRQELIPNLGYKNATNTKRIDAISPVIGKRNSDRLKAILDNEQKIQRQANDFREIRPRAVGIEGGSGENVTRNIMQSAVTKNVSGVIGGVEQLGRKLLSGKGAEYQKRLAEDLTHIILTTDKKEVAKRLSMILREQNDMMKAAKMRKVAGVKSSMMVQSGDETD